MKWGFSCEVRPLAANNCYCRMCHGSYSGSEQNYMKRGDLVLALTIETAGGTGRTFLCKKHAKEFGESVKEALKVFDK